MQITSKFNGKCTACSGRIAAGEKCEWNKGEGIRHIGACPKQEPVQSNVTVTMGVFRKDGRIFVVKPNKEKTRVYAKEIIQSPPRMTEAGEVVDFESRYAPGAIYNLSEADRWDLADAKEFLTKYARCIVCGAHLKAAKSVAGAIGPVCAKYFAHRNGSTNGAVQAAPAVTEYPPVHTGLEENIARLEAKAKADAIAAQVIPHLDATNVAVAPENVRELADEIKPHASWVKRMNEAKANAHKVTPELIAHIKRINEQSRAWQAAGPNRWAGILAEEPEHWALYGIYTLADFHAMQDAEDEKERRKNSYYID